MRALSILAAEAHGRLSRRRRRDPGPTSTYLSSATNGATRSRSLNASSANVYPVFTAALAAQRRRETGAGISLVGPHRDDVSIKLNGVDLATFGSRAQIRTAALSLRLAEARPLPRRIRRPSRPPPRRRHLRARRTPTRLRPQRRLRLPTKSGTPPPPAPGSPQTSSPPAKPTTSPPAKSAKKNSQASS